MRRNFLWVVVFGLSAANPAIFAQDKPTAESVLKEAIEAAGGQETLKKFPALRQKVKGTMEIGGMELSIKGDVAYMAPDKLKVTLETAVMGQKFKILQLINGTSYRANVAGMEQKLDEDGINEMKETLVDIQISLLYPLLDGKAFDVKLLPETVKVEGAEARVLTVKPKDAKEYRVFIDVKSHLITKTEKQGKDPETKKEGLEEEFVSDYKKVQGIMVAMKTRVVFEGKKKADIEVTEAKFSDKIPDAEFDISD